MDPGSVEARFLVSITKQTTPRRHFRAITMKQSCYQFSKIYYVLKFGLSKSILAPSGPIFVFRSLNKLGPLASESINYEAKTIINFKNKSTHQISAL